MKVLILSSFFPISLVDEKPKFILEQTITLANSYPEDSYHVLAASDESGLQMDMTIPSNLRVTRFSYMWPRKYQLLTKHGILSAVKKSPFNMLSIPLLFFFEYLAIKRQIRQISPDVIYAHWFLPQGILLWLLSGKTRSKIVLTSHSSDIEILIKLPLIGKWLVKKALLRFDRLSFVSRNGLKILKMLYHNHELDRQLGKSKVMPMGVSDVQISQVMALKKTMPNSGGLNMLFMGRLVDKKGVFYLLHAIKELKDLEPNVHMTLAGDGYLKKEIIQFITDHSLEKHIELPGFISNIQKVEVLAAADIFILPSIITNDGDREGLPVGLLENMIVGNICIASDVSGADDIIENGKNGYIIASRSSAEIVDTLLALKRLSNKEKEEIRNNAINTTSKYRWSKLIEEYYGLFR